jgi:acetyl-CoA C-acetyltransferase
MSVFIHSGMRTPNGAFLGQLSTVEAPKLGSLAIKAALEKAGVNSNQVDEVFMGNVLQTGLGQAPARQSALYAGLSNSVPCTTINKVCGSGLKSIITAAQSILAGDNQMVIAGGMENMSQAPHFLSLRKGVKFANATLVDALSHDGLTDAYSKDTMGLCAEKCAQKFAFDQASQDKFAKESYLRAQWASKEGIFSKEITPVTIKTKKGDLLIKEDEGPFLANFEKMKELKPAFQKDGTITAANASTINDGAAAILLSDQPGEFEIIAHSCHAQKPEWFSTAPISAIKKCLDKAQMKISDVDLFEINEAFSVVVMATMKELQLDWKKVNVFGGAVSLGHPIGQSGTRIVVTLMNALKHFNLTHGLASICIGGGEALAILIRRNQSIQA